MLSGKIIITMNVLNDKSVLITKIAYITEFSETTPFRAFKNRLD